MVRLMPFHFLPARGARRARASRDPALDEAGDASRRHGTTQLGAETKILQIVPIVKHPLVLI